MGVISQFHKPAALPPTKEPPVPIKEEDGWASEPVETFWRIVLIIVSAGKQIVFAKVSRQ
jgi:hypothetical protein